VQITESGLQYKVIEEGEGDTPQASDKVTVHYTGKLIDGTVFDSSIPRGEPTEFGVTQVIPGWVEGLQLMKPGAKYEFYMDHKVLSHHTQHLSSKLSSSRLTNFNRSIG